MLLLQIPPNRIPRQQAVVWIKDGHAIVTAGTKKYLHQRRKKKLVIRSLSVMDSGVYECALSSNSTEKGRAELLCESSYRIARNFCGPKILRIAVKRSTADNISANYTFNC